MVDVASSASESFEQAVRPFREIVENATKFHLEFFKGCQEMLGAAALPAWQKKAQAVVNNMIDVAQTNADETLQAMEQNLRTGMELWQKAFITNADGPADGREEAAGFWQQMAGLLRTNTETMLRTNSRLGNTWMEMAGIVSKSGQSPDN